MRIVRLLRGQQRGPIAITRLQAIVRGFIVRTKRAAVRSKVLYEAALKIQLAIRRYLAKTRVAVRASPPPPPPQQRMVIYSCCCVLIVRTCGCN